MSDLISRQNAIKAIEDLPNCYNGFSDTYDKACIIGTLEEVPSAQQWISCSERLPEVHTDVLATTVWGDITIAERLDDSSWFIGEGYSNANDEDIVAWQELPEPYMRGEEE